VDNADQICHSAGASGGNTNGGRAFVTECEGDYLLKGVLLMFAAIVIFAFAAGIILGTRFRVFVLAPAILFAIISTVPITFANGISGGASVLVALAVIVSLQCGYVAGVAAAYFAERSKLPRRTWRPSPFY
jgi:hypothetical protein